MLKNIANLNKNGQILNLIYKYMKKILITIAIIVSITSVTFASTVILRWEDQSRKIKDGDFQELTNWYLNEHSLRMFKVADDKTICYVLYPALPNGNVYSPTMQCSIK